MKQQSILLATVTFTMLASQTAEAGTYYPKYKILTETNGTQTTGTARSAIASGVMGVKGYGNYDLDLGANELSLVSSCKTKTPQPSSWPEQCNIDGLAKALTAKVAGQNWISAKYTKFQQTEAVNKLANNIITYGSPSLIPIYGQADHYATVIWLKATVINNSVTLDGVAFYDAGYAIDQNMDIQFDNGGKPYSDGLLFRQVDVFKGDWYLLLTGVAPNDPFYNQYVMSYEPPVVKMAKEPLIHHGEAFALVDHSADMNAETARDLAFEALELADLLEVPEFRHIAVDGTADRAWRVDSVMPDGSPAPYYLVAITSTIDGSLLGTVGLSAEDGSLMRVWAAARPVPMRMFDDAAAAQVAQSSLAVDERLVGGEVRWDGNCGDNYCRSPDFPYYEYSVVKDGKPAGKVVVPIYAGRGVRRR